jgi:hypothetical protein
MSVVVGEGEGENARRAVKDWSIGTSGRRFGGNKEVEGEACGFGGGLRLSDWLAAAGHLARSCVPALLLRGRKGLLASPRRGKLPAALTNVPLVP